MTFRLLVADDSITIQKIVTMAFEVEDVEVEGIGNGQDAFDRIPDFKPDIVLADVDMPGLDGFELSKKIKASPEMGEIKVLLLASDFEDFDEHSYQDCGADSHISKPFKSDDIVTKVKNVLGSSGGGGDEENIGVAAQAASNHKVPESGEEPSLDELLDSVEKLSTEGVSFSDSEEEILVENEMAELSEEEMMVPMDLSDLDELADKKESLGSSEETSKGGINEPKGLSEISEPQEDFENADLQEEFQAAIAPGTEIDIMDRMIRGVEDLKDLVKPPPSEEKKELSVSDEESGSVGPQEEGGIQEISEEPEIFAEVRPRRMDDVEELDSTFKEIVRGGRGASAHREGSEHPAELSSLGGIVPEPEDLLEHIAPGAFSKVGKRPATPQDIKQNLDCLSRFSEEDQMDSSAYGDLPSRKWDYEAGDEQTSRAIADEVRQILQTSLGFSVKKEVAGLSDVILKTVREVVREITPEIARKMIREEIEKIKKQDMV